MFENIEVAKSFFSKLTGLIFKKNLKIGQGFLIENCSSIHTFWLRFPIDVLFLDKNNKILHVITNLKPFRITPFIKGSVKVLEIKAGEIKRLGLKPGNFLNVDYNFTQPL